MEKKITKKEQYASIKEIILVAEVTEEEKVALVEFVDRQVELLEAKAAKSKEREAAKRAASDELKAIVAEHVTETYQTVDAIAKEVAAVEGCEEVTRAKVVSRLGKLVADGVVSKEAMKAEDGRKVMHYALVAGVSVEDIAE